MRKSDKKLEKSIVSALTDACEEDLKTYEGFQWLTHIVNFHSFPDSLSIICVFDTQENLIKITGNNTVNEFKAAIENRLLSGNIKVRDIKRRIVFDTEEACENEHDGNWNKRLDGLQNARHA
ncbi:Fis family transcriptional regulator [Pleionea sp. CnH1-48]|uniref:Fis family transcriptional regulator n=1 Tax=Pleionea sp. CnH1-48 TaxID=2954494 RepID=UPI002096A300|nr:Fis family transcriptional regulator [Pleionea sp. CnH1-48]MCO7222718.1 Fis family transcriptional regulator [Pleionea sp. CnH1-48]